MRNRSSVVLFAMLILLASCADPEPEPAPPPDTGAGTVTRLDAALDAIVPVDARIEKLHSSFQFTEGPVWVTEGGPFLLFSDIPANAIYKWTPDGQVSDFIKPVFEAEYEEGRFVGSNGLTLDSEGRLVLCEHGAGHVSRVEKDGQRTVLVAKYKGKRLNSPNDAVYRSDGSLYFTDPPYGFAKLNDDPAKELDFNGVYRLSSDGELELLSRDQTFPNGIAFSPDEKTLYVANSDGDNRVWMAYDLNEDGVVGKGRVFYDANASEAEGVPDGLKIDKLGNLYCTGPGGVLILSPEGKHLGTIAPAELPANVAWGDADGKTLYITARSSIYRIRLNIEGLRP